MNDRQSLESTRVETVMTRDVVEVEVNQSMCCAASTLVKHGLSAAPVVDEHGRCVGILTGADFVKRECQHADDCESQLAVQRHELVKQDDHEPLHMESHPEDRVRYHMSPSVQSVPADASLLHAATVMSQSQLHHLVVLDAHGRPAGILSTIDVVRTMLPAAGDAPHG